MTYKRPAKYAGGQDGPVRTPVLPDLILVHPLEKKFKNSVSDVHFQIGF